MHVSAGVILTLLIGSGAVLSAPDPVDLGTLPGYVSNQALGINDSGTVFGQATNVDGQSRAVRWDPDGAITDLGILGGYFRSEATDIDDDGWTVGTVSTADGQTQAVRWDRDGLVGGIGGLPGTGWALAVAINGAGTVTGQSSVDGDRHAVLWR